MKNVGILTAIAGLLLLLAGWKVAFFTIANKQMSALAQTAPRADFNRAPASKGWSLYAPNPNHLWNRLYRSLYRRLARDGREYGYDELDPILWYRTRYLLIKPAYQQASALLDEFLSTHAEKEIKDPLKRAVFQRDLWAIFDWSTQSSSDSHARLNLQIKLVEVIKRLALSPDQILALPNTFKEAAKAGAFATAYALNQHEQPFLPPDLFDQQGPWVRLSVRGSEPVAQGHVIGFSGRSVFLVFIRLPEGRDSTLKYLQRLSEFPRPWLPDPEDPRRLLPNPDLPEFPAGTQLALVREMVLIDSQGNFRSTNIVEDVQIRVHRTVPSEIRNFVDTDRNEARTALDVYEFKFSRSKLFAGAAGGLRAVAAEETEFPLFQSQDIDLFEEVSGGIIEGELRVSLKACASCHFRPGVHSMLSRGHEEILPSWDLNNEADRTKEWKGRQYNWGLLRGLWNSQ